MEAVKLSLILDKNRFMSEKSEKFAIFLRYFCFIEFSRNFLIELMSDF